MGQYTQNDDRSQADWLSCPECGSSRVDVDKGGGWTPAISFNCRSCPAANSFYL